MQSGQDFNIFLKLDKDIYPPVTEMPAAFMPKSCSLLVFHSFSLQLTVSASYFGDTGYLIYISPIL